MTPTGPWTWDPRRDPLYRSRDGRTRGHLGLLFAGMREVAKSDPALSPAQRIRRRGMLKVASLAAVFGMYAASTPRSDAKPGTPHQIIAADGMITVTAATPERPGPYAFPPGAALVEGAGRLTLTLLMHEVRVRGGEMPQVDTDGGFILATPEGGPVDDEDRA
jgi:hypothetical protein